MICLIANPFGFSRGQCRRPVSSNAQRRFRRAHARHASHAGWPEPTERSCAEHRPLAALVTARAEQLFTASYRGVADPSNARGFDVPTSRRAQTMKHPDPDLAIPYAVIFGSRRQLLALLASGALLRAPPQRDQWGRFLARNLVGLAEQSKSFFAVLECVALISERPASPVEYQIDRGAAPSWQGPLG